MHTPIIKNISASRARLLRWGIPLFMVLSFWVLAYRGDLRQAVPLLLGVTACAVMMLAAVRYVLEQQGMDWPPVAILGVALLLRLPFLFRSPELSDDIYRYVWDGLNLLAGVNPYGAPPTDMTPVSPVAAALQPLINHPDLITIYPPGAQLCFAVGALTGSVLGLKCLLVGLDLLLCLLLIRLLRACDLPISRAVLYAWHPLPVLEIAGSGHIDGAAMLLMLAALLLLTVNRSPWVGLGVGALAALGVLVKLFPLVLIPGLFLVAERRQRLLLAAGALVTAVMLCLPFIPELANGCQTVARYFCHWEFSGWSYQTIRQFGVNGSLTRLLLASVFGLIGLAVHLPVLQTGPSQRLHTLPQLWYALILAYLLLAPTLYPWYVLYLVCLFPFVAGPAGLVLSWSVLLGYGVVMFHGITGIWREIPLVAWGIWWGPALAWFASLMVARRRTGC